MVNASRLKNYGAVLAIFVLGAIAGSGVTHALSQRRMAGLVGERPELWERRRLGALARKLDLDGAQAEGVRAVFERHRDERRRLTRDMFERCGEPLRAAQQVVDAEIRASLRPDQQTRFDQLAKERRDRFPFGPHE